MEKKKTQKLTQAERTKISKERIVQEANRLFGEYGYSGTRMSDIAEAAGLTLPGLLHHFSNKEELLIKVLEFRDRGDQKFYEELLKNSEGKKTLEILYSLVKHNQKMPEMVQIFTVMAAESITPEHPGHAYFVSRYRHFRQQYLSLLKEAQKKGQIRSDINMEELGMLVIAIMDGLQLQWLLDPEKVDMTAAFLTFSKIFERGLQDISEDS